MLNAIALVKLDSLFEKGRQFRKIAKNLQSGVLFSVKLQTLTYIPVVLNQKPDE